LEYKIWFEPLGLRIACPEGSTIFEAARDAGISLTSICGGRGMCGQCRVQLSDGSASPISEREKACLNEQEIDASFRLACETQPLSDLRVYLPQTSLAIKQRLQLLGIDVPSALDPVLSEYELDVRGSILEEPFAVWENLCQHLAERCGLPSLRADLASLQCLPLILRSSGPTIGITVRGDEVIDIHPAGQRLLGVAIDLGTTKIVAYLVDLNTGESLAARGVTNSQVAYGEDVMSRITYALEGGGNELRSSVTGALNQLIGELTENSEQVLELTLVGNTAMHHLLLGLPVLQLGQAPYVPAVRSSLDVKARGLGLRVAPGAYVHLLPNIAGFVGSDHVAMLMAAGLHETDKTVLGIDIGTNTEVSLVRKGIISTLSCASGPAFEGAHIRHGMKAASGAIESVSINHDRIELGVIDDVPPVGICGSGILDAIAQLRQHRVIDRRGRLQGHPLVRQGDNGREFILADVDGTEQNISITGGDIAEIQLAKAAIRTGINTLLDEGGMGIDEIDEVIIAGAFGSYIDVSSAIAIGMLPSLSLERFKQVGNAAGIGARLALMSKRHRSIAQNIAERVRYIELASHPRFQKEFSQSTRLP
jgi:uncharacterized 2Fe-2S/4Fe-4S cluster protein (DUF4445 family)